MRLDLQLVRHLGNDCLEDLVATVTSFWGIGYEMTFLDSWNFHIQPVRPGSTGILGERILPVKGNMRELLRKYHNLDLILQDQTSSNAILSIIQVELGRKFPVIIRIPMSWIPWGPNYQKKEGERGHSTLIMGLEDQYLICADTLSNTAGSLLPLEDFHQGVAGCITFKRLAQDAAPVDWRAAILNALDKLHGPVNSTSMFDRIRFLAGLIETELDYAAEIRGLPNITNAPINGNLKAIGSGRIQFARALQYLHQKFGIPDLLSLCNDLEIAGSGWETARNILIKGWIAKNMAVMQKQAALKLREIADLEERIAQRLAAIANYDQDPILKVRHEPPVSRGAERPPELEYLDLSSYYNNNAFGTFTDECTADISGYHQFLLRDNLPEDRIWTVGRMQFCFPPVKGGAADNIACLKQEITLPEGLRTRMFTGASYTGIMILGCSEWGSYSDLMDVKYQNGAVEPMNIRFTDYGKKPFYGETIAWEGKGAEIKEGKVRFVLNNPQNRLYLFAQEYSFRGSDVVASLILPECPNIHIFAITLFRIPA